MQLSRCYSRVCFFQGIDLEKGKAILSRRRSSDEGFDPLLNAKKIYEGKYISSYEFWSGEKFEKVEVDYSTFKNFDDFFIQLKEISGERLSGLYLNLDTKDWTVNSFDESPEGFMEMKERIKELGFVLSEEEENEWKEFIEYKYE